MASIEARRAALQQKMKQANAIIVKNGRDLQRAADIWMTAARKDALLALLAQLVTCFGRLVQRTPVDTGRARAGWHIAGESDESGTPTFVRAPNLPIFYRLTDEERQ